MIIQTLAELFIGIVMLILKFVLKGKVTRTAKMILKVRNKARKIILCYFQTYVKMIVLKTG